jgi:ubiquinone/menaquinone biosynthesis C-methylase UbiE
MPDLLSIYQHEASKYDLLVSREDHDGNLLRALCEATPLHGKRVVEFGAGTGRVTLLLAPIAKSILAFDSAEPMIKVAEKILQEAHLHNWKFEVADHRKVPAPTHSADVAIAGWSICCLAAYEGENWQRELETGLAEMERVIVPGGTTIIIETLGTGYSSPNAPEGLRPYYGILDTKGFRSTWIRTDYRFSSMEEAIDLTTFFFGKDPLSAIIESQDGVLLPECTGIWWRQG